MAEQLGFVGLGIMGQAMALNLVNQNRLLVYNRTPERTLPLLERGAVRGDSPADLARQSSIIFLMLSNDEAVDAVARGSQGVLDGARPGTVIVDHSTISPALTRELANEAWNREVTWCDAPVTGGDQGARAAMLTIMVGGPESTFTRIEPYLQQMGRRLVHVGEAGQGQTLKLVANMVSALTLMAASEGLRMGLELGISLDAVETVMKFGSAASYELDKVVQRLKDGDYDAGFSVENRYKDLRLAIELAQQQGFSAPLAEFGHGLYGAHRDAGFGTWDETSYIKRWGDDA